MEFVKIDDPRLDESYSYLFTFKIGDRVRGKLNPGLRGDIKDGVYVGEFPAHIAASDDTYKKGKTLYEIKISETETFIVADSEIEKA